MNKGKCRYSLQGWYSLWLKSVRLVVSPIIYRVSYIPGGAGFQPSTVSQGFMVLVSTLFCSRSSIFRIHWDSLVYDGSLGCRYISLSLGILAHRNWEWLWLAILSYCWWKESGDHQLCFWEDPIRHRFFITSQVVHSPEFWTINWLPTRMVLTDLCGINVPKYPYHSCNGYIYLHLA